MLGSEDCLHKSDRELYWKQRCLAAERFGDFAHDFGIVISDAKTWSELYINWQQLKNQAMTSPL